ncbi:MAG: hypothetical protein JSU92_09930 [Deltaproteobacteria bacterium]|nr:MAG: hypothetical protein JSU92_09930 [Deltaproteobacteria bacterium]
MGKLSEKLQEMTGNPNLHIKEVLELVRQLIIVADQGELDCEDDGCRVLYGIIRDCAYKIKAQAEHEREIHKQKGTWDVERGTGTPLPKRTIKHNKGGKNG